MQKEEWIQKGNGSFWAYPFLPRLSFCLYLTVFGKARGVSGEGSSRCPDVVTGFSGVEVRIQVGAFCWQCKMLEIKMQLSG